MSNKRIGAWAWVWILFAIISTYGDTSKFDIDHQKLERVHRAFESWRALAKEAETDPSAEKIERLALGVWKLGQKSIYPLEERFDVRQEVVNSIISIPRHGDYLQAIIDKEREAWQSGKAHRYDDVRLRIIHTFEVIPSLESVRVLGELLSDDSGVPYPHGEDPGTSSPPENPIYAQEALTVLLDDPPADGRQSVPLHIREDDLKTWQLWFEQVKAGTRTFRFKGDPQPYTLEGPAERELRPGADNADPENHRRRTTQNREAAGSEDSADDPAQGANHWWMVGGGLGLVAVILLVWRKLRRTNAKR